MSEFELNAKTYYSLEADKRYMSVHEYLDFAGHMGVYGCEERAMAKLNGEWEDEITDAMLIGSYVDAWFEGTLDEFKEEHPEMFTTVREIAVSTEEMMVKHPDWFTRNGRLKSTYSRVKIESLDPSLLKVQKVLKAQYKIADIMIERCKRDELFMKFMSGEKQKIFTGELFGCEWKCKLDSYIPGKCIVDLKTSANIHKAWKVLDYGWASFVEYWGYTLQLAVYQKIVEINTGEHLPCYIAVVTKEDEPEIEIVEIDDFTLQNALNEIKMNMPSVLAVKNGDAKPIRCNKCDYCKSTKKLVNPINYRDLIIEGE